MPSYTITLPDQASHKLSDLISSAYTSALLEFSEVQLLADVGNGANNIAVGSSDVSDTVYSYILSAGSSRLYRRERGRPLIYLSTLYVKANAGTPKLHIEGRV